MNDFSEGPTTIPRAERIAERFKSMSMEELSRVYMVKPGTQIYFDPRPEIYDSNDGRIAQSTEVGDGYYAIINPNHHSRLTRGGKIKPVIKETSKTTLEFQATVEDIPVIGPQGNQMLGDPYIRNKFNVFANPAWLSYPTTLPGGIKR